MGVVHARVDDCHNNAAISPGLVTVILKPLPRFLYAGASQMPLIGLFGIVCVDGAQGATPAGLS